MSGSAPSASSEFQSRFGGHSWCRQARWERQDNDETPDEGNKIHEQRPKPSVQKLKFISKSVKEDESFPSGLY